MPVTKKLVAKPTAFEIERGINPPSRNMPKKLSDKVINQMRNIDVGESFIVKAKKNYIGYIVSGMNKFSGVGKFTCWEDDAGVRVYRQA